MFLIISHLNINAKQTVNDLKTFQVRLWSRFLHVLCVGSEPVAGPGPRLPHDRKALHQRPPGVLPPGGHELSLLQPFHLRLVAQQGAHPPERLLLSQLPQGGGGESLIQELICSTPIGMSEKQWTNAHDCPVFTAFAHFKTFILVVQQIQS